MQICMARFLKGLQQQIIILANPVARSVFAYVLGPVSERVRADVRERQKTERRLCGVLSTVSVYTRINHLAYSWSSL
jgi:hypothetical protein